MARGISLLIAAIFALMVVSVQTYDSQAAETTGTPIPVTVQPQPGGFAPDYPYPPQVLVLTLADSGGSFVVPLNSYIWVNVPILPNSYFNYNPSILQPSLGWPVPLPYMEGDGVPPQGTPIPVEPPYWQPNPGSDMYSYGYWQFIAVGTGTTNLSVGYTPCYGRICPKYPVYNFSVTITVNGYYPPPQPYPTPIPPYPTDWPPYIGSADVYIGTAYLDQVVSVHVGQTVRIDLPFIAAQEAVRVDYDRNVLQPLDGQQFDHPQRGGWLFRVIGAGSTIVTVNSQRCMSDGGSNCNTSLLFRVTIKSS